jgi:hypothetical protein
MSTAALANQATHTASPDPLTGLSAVDAALHVARASDGVQDGDQNRVQEKASHGLTPAGVDLDSLRGQVAGRLDAAARVGVGALLLHGALDRPLERRVAALVSRSGLRGLGCELAASFCLEAIEVLREQVADAEQERRVANAPLAQLVRLATEADEGGLRSEVLEQAAGVSAEALRRALGLCESPADGGLPAHVRFGVPLRMAEAVAEALDVAPWRVRLMSDEFLASWTPAPWAVQVVEQFGWLTVDGAGTSERAWCTRVLREEGLDLFHQEQVIAWARRRDGLPAVDFTARRPRSLITRLAQWEAAAERHIPEGLRRRQVGASRTVFRKGALWLVARRLVSGWVLERVVGGSEERTVVVAEFAAHEALVNVETVAMEVAAGEFCRG